MQDPNLGAQCRPSRDVMRPIRPGIEYKPISSAYSETRLSSRNRQDPNWPQPMSNNFPLLRNPNPNLNPPTSNNLPTNKVNATIDASHGSFDTRKYIEEINGHPKFYDNIEADDKARRKNMDIVSENGTHYASDHTLIEGALDGQMRPDKWRYSEKGLSTSNLQKGDVQTNMATSIISSATSDGAAGNPHQVIPVDEVEQRSNSPLNSDNTKPPLVNIIQENKAGRQQAGLDSKKTPEEGQQLLKTPEEFQDNNVSPSCVSHDKDPVTKCANIQVSQEKNGRTLQGDEHLAFQMNSKHKNTPQWGTHDAPFRFRDGSNNENIPQRSTGKDPQHRGATQWVSNHGVPVARTNASNSLENGHSMAPNDLTVKDLGPSSEFQFFRTCPHCYRNYHWPYLLKCFHSFCFRCLAKMYDNVLREIKCPLCALTTTVGEKGPFDLNVDTNLCSRMSTFSDPLACTACTLPKSIIHVYCVTCMHLLCTSCRFKHSSSPTSADHKLEDVNKLKTIRGKIYEMCSIHPNIIVDRFCQDCRIGLCGMCERYCGSKHRGHSILRDVKHLKNRIETINAETDRMKNHMRKQVQPMILKKQEVESKSRACKRSIHLYSNQIIADINKTRSEVRGIMDETIDHIANVIKSYTERANKLRDDYQTFGEFTTRYLEDPEPSHFLRVLPLIKQRCLKLMAEREEIRKLEKFLRAELMFSPEFPPVNDIITQSYNVDISESLNELLNNDTEISRTVRSHVEEIMSNKNSDIASQIRDEFLVRENNKSVSRSASTEPSINSKESDISDDSQYNFPRTCILSIHGFGERGSGNYSFGEPSGVVYLLDGSLAVCDTGNHRIVIYDKDYKYVTTIGQPPITYFRLDDHGKRDKHVPKLHGCLYFPYRFAQCPKSGNLVIVERPPSRAIQVFALDGGFVRRFANDVLQHPRGVAVDEDGVIVVVEGKTMKLMIFAPNGMVMQTFHLCVELEFPNDIAAKNGIIYISDNRGHCVHTFDYNGRSRGTIGNECVTYYPIGVSVNYMNNVVVTDNHNTFNMSIFDADGKYLYGYKSGIRHANCYNVAVHPSRCELAVTSRDCSVIIFDYTPPPKSTSTVSTNESNNSVKPCPTKESIQDTLNPKLEKC